LILERLSIINYKNIQETTLKLSPNINCFIGHNGAGKTNVLDAVYFLSFCHSAQTTQDSLVIRHDQDFFMLEGEYAETENGERRTERYDYLQSQGKETTDNKTNYTSQLSARAC
jgi:DNA replication and repair protein RecF